MNNGLKCIVGCIAVSCIFYFIISCSKKTAQPINPGQPSFGGGTVVSGCMYHSDCKATNQYLQGRQCLNCGCLGRYHSYR